MTNQFGHVVISLCEILLEKVSKVECVLLSINFLTVNFQITYLKSNLKEKKFKCNLCTFIDDCINILTEFEKPYEKQFGSKYEICRDNNQNETIRYFGIKLKILPIHERLSKLHSKKIQMNFDGTSFHLSAMWDETSVYPKIEPRNSFTTHVNKNFVNAFHIKTFSQDGNESAMFKKILTDQN